MYIFLLLICCTEPIVSIAGEKDDDVLKAMFFSYTFGGNKSYWNGPHNWLFTPPNFGIHSENGSISLLINKNHYFELIYASEYQLIRGPGSTIITYKSQDLQNTNNSLSIMYGKALQFGPIFVGIDGGASFANAKQYFNIQAYYKGPGVYTTSSADNKKTQIMNWILKGKFAFALTPYLGFNIEKYVSSNSFHYHDCTLIGISIGYFNKALTDQ